MGLTCFPVCATCKVAGPPIGDFGYLGHPSISTKLPTEKDGDDIIPFGYAYTRFVDIGILTDELEATAEFLRQHQSHRLLLYADGFDPSVEDADELDRAIDNDGDEPLGYQDFEARARNGFVIGQYVVSCRCGKELAVEPTILRPLPDVRWTSTLLERLRELLNIDETYRLTEPLIDPSARGEQAPLRQIEQFVSRHLSHGVTSRVVPVTDATPSKPVASPAPAPGTAAPSLRPLPASDADLQATWRFWVFVVGGVLFVISGLYPAFEQGRPNWTPLAIGVLFLAWAAFLRTKRSR